MTYEQLGIIGAVLAGLAYIPQITHLIKEKCTHGISLFAFTLWFIAAVLITIHALAISAAAFILLGLIQITATAIILFYCFYHRGAYCAFHLKPPKKAVKKSELSIWL